MWTFAPTLVLPSGAVPLPRPITQLRVQDQWEAASFTVPLRDGSVRRGRSRGGIDLAIRGQFAVTAEGLALSESDMFDAIDDVRMALHLGGPEVTYGLALFVDATNSGNRRGFIDCTTVKFEYDLSDRALFGYSLLIHASDPAMRTGPLTAS